MKEYVKEYFDRHAGAWVESAYAHGSRFPIGEERVRLAIEGVADAVPDGGTLVDLGCGGGQLCVHAAALGWSAVGVDVAPGMIEEARRRSEGLDVRFVVGSFDESGLEDAGAHAVTALGLVEYLPDDDALFAEARRLLPPGGRFAVSCRNRLYNLQSANRYTARELDGGAAELLEELERRLGDTRPEDLQALADELAAAAPELAEAARLDAAEPPPDLHDHTTVFTEERRQHTPDELAASAVRHGFEAVALYALHPHPLPPGVEPVSPRVYNRLALAWQRALERSSPGLASSSAFVAVLQC